MAGEDNKKFGYEPNFKWPPERYYNLASYVLMFNGIANDHDDYGIENSNGDQVINEYIKTHLEELLARDSYDVIPSPKGMPKPPLTPAQKPGVPDAEYAQLLIKGGYKAKIDKYKQDLQAWERADDYVDDPNRSPASNAREKAKLVEKRAQELAKYKSSVKKLKEDLPNLISMSKELARKANYDGKYISNMLTNEQMAQVLREKYDGVRSWHEDVRKHVKGKSGKKDKDGAFDHWHDWDNAQAERLNKNKIVRRNGWRTFRRFAATALFGAVTLASVGALLSYGGFALTAMFGTAFNAAGVSGSVLGFVGTVAGGTFTKKFFGRALDSMNEGRKLRRDRREYMRSFGKYADKYEDGKTRQAKGYRNIRQRYYEDLAIMTFLEKGGLDTTVKKGLKGKELREAKAKAKFNKKLQMYLDRGLKRGTIVNPFADGGQPLDLAQLQKESRFYRFVTDKSDKQPYGFDHIFAKLAAAKSMNVNDVHSVQAETILAEEFLRKAKTGGHTLEEAKLKLEELKRGESKFAEHQDNKNKFQELLYEFSDVIMDSMDRELFENVYNSDLVGTRKDMYNVPEIKERYEKTREGDCTEQAENAFEFVEALRKDKFAGGVLNDEVEASINDQVHIDRAHMENACSRYNVPQEVEDPSTPGVMIPNPVYAAVQTACAQIGSISSKGSDNDVAYEAVSRAIDTIESAIPASDCNIKAARYLKYMRDKKVSETTHDKDSLDAVITKERHGVIPEAIRTSIVDINDKTTPAQIAKIRSDIMADATLALPANKEARDFAIKLVQSQIESIERKKRNNAIIGAMPSIRGNLFHEYKEYMEMLPKEDEAQIDTKKCSSILSKFEKVLPKEMSNLLVLKLKDRVCKILQTEALHFSVENTNENAIETTISKLQAFMQSVGIAEKNKLIDSWQKDVCLNLIGTKIKSAFDSYLKNIEKQFLENGSAATMGKVEKFFWLAESGGFKEYLDSNTQDSDWLKNRLQRIIDATDLERLMTAEGKGGFGNLVCASNEETRHTLRIYFREDRATGDSHNMVELIEKMQLISKNTVFDKAHPEYVVALNGSPIDFDGDGVATNDITSFDKNKSYVASMVEFVDNLKPVREGGIPTGKILYYEYDGKKITNDDAMAVMLVAKKRTLSMLKAHMNLIYTTYGDRNSLSDYLNSYEYRGKHRDRMTSAWKVLTEKLDDKLTEINKVVSSAEYQGFSNITQAMENALIERNFSSYMTSQEMNS